MPLAYRQVKDIYDALHDAGATQESLPEWAARRNTESESDRYSAGLHDNWIKRSSVALDRLIERSGAPDVTAPVGRAIGDLIGAPDVGERIGRGLPRMAATFAPLAIPGPGWVTAAGLATAGALGGAETYTATGSPAAGALSAFTNIALPGVANTAARLAGPGIRGIVAGQAAAAGTMQASEFGQQAIAGEPLSVHPTDMLLQMTLGQLPFIAAHEGAKLIRGENIHAVDKANQLLDLRAAKDRLDLQAPIESLPNVDQTQATPQTHADIASMIAKSRGLQVKISEDPTLTPEQKFEKTNQLLQEEGDLIRQHAEVQVPHSTFGDVPDAGERTQMVGKQMKETKGSRTVYIEDLPVNPEELRGKVVTYSKGTLEKAPEVRSDGNTVFDVSSPQWRTAKTKEEWDAYGRKPIVVDPLQPELPIQSKPATDAEITAHISELNKVNVDTENAQTTADLQKALVRLQHVQEDAGLPVTTDVHVQQKIKDLAASGLVAPENVVKTALKAITSKTVKLVKTRPSTKPLQKVDETSAVASAAIATAETIAKQPEGLDYAPIQDTMDNLLAKTRLHKDIQQQFDNWKTKNPAAKTDFETEADRFKIYWTLKKRGDIGNEDTLNSKDVEIFNDELKKHEINPDNPQDLVDFPDRDHIRGLDDEVTNQLMEIKSVNSEPARPDVPETPEKIAEQLGLRYDGLSLGGKGKQFTNTEVGKETSLDVPVNASLEDVAKAFGKPVSESSEFRADEPYLPDSPEEQATMDAMGTTGESLLKFISEQTADPMLAVLGKDLAKFKDSLKFIDVRVGRTKSGGSVASRMSNDRMRITISDARLRQHPSILAYSSAHELVHGLTILELEKPTNVKYRNELEDVRQRLIKALPKDLQTRLQEIINSDWAAKRSKGADNWKEFFPDQPVTKRAILYGLLNVKELVAQGLGDRPLQDYMRSVKSTEGGSWFHRFTGLVKQMLGVGRETSDTVWEEFLSKTDQLLDHGNFVSSFRDFSENYFKNLGMSESMATVQSRRALGVMLESGYGVTTSDILNHLADPGPIRSGDLLEAGRGLFKMIKDNGDTFQEHSTVMDEAGYGSDRPELDSFVQDSLLGMMQKHTDVIDMLPKESQDYVFAKLKDMQDVLGALKAAVKEKNEGLLNLTNPKALRSPLESASKQVDKMLSAREEWQESKRLVDRMQGITPDGFVEVHSAPEPGMEDVKEAFSRETIQKPKRGFGWFMNPVAQWARSNPLTAELISRGYELEPAARDYQGRLLKVLGIDLKGDQQLSKETVKAAIKTIQSPRTLNALNKWMALNQTEARTSKTGVVMLDVTHPKVQELLKGLTPEEKSGVFDMAKRGAAMTQVGQISALNYMAKIASAKAATIIVKDQPLKASQAVPLAEQIFNSLLVDPNDAQAVQVADANLRTAQSKMSPEGFLDVLKYLQVEVEKYKLWKNHFNENPAWASAQRQEKYLVSFSNGKKRYQLQASSTKEANEIFEKLGGVGRPVIEENFKGRGDEFPTLGPDAPAMMARLQELEQNQMKMLEGKLSPEQMDAIKAASPVTQFGREAAATGGGIPSFRPPPRLLSQGAEELPWLWNHISWAQRQSNYWTRQLYRAQADLHLSEPELAARPDLSKALRQQVDNLLQPDPQIVQKINRFTSTWFMGFAPASAMVNGMQTLSTLVPELTNITGRPLKSYATWKSAIAEVTKSTGGRWKNPEIDALMREAEKTGEIDYSMWDETAQSHEQIANDFKRSMMKNKPQNLGQRLNTAAGSWSTAAMWMFKTVEKFNHRVTLVAAYKTYRELGFTEAEATQKAFEVNRAVNYGGGRASRSIGLYSGKDSFSRGAAMLATNMQNYNFGVIGQLARFLQTGYFRPEGLKPAEVYAARKAATQMLATQLAAAGLLGLPFVSGMLALLNQAFPNLELNKKLRESVASFFGSDKENGNILGDAAMTGLPSMLGWDMQSRLSMGNITPGVSEYNGFQPQLLLGPPANLVSNFVNGALKVTQGEPAGAAAFIPPGLKKLVQYAAGDGTIKDYKDRPLFHPSVGEQAGIALGFQPKRLSDLNAASRMAEQTTTLNNRREGQWRQNQAEDILKGNFGTVRQALLERVRQDKNYDLSQAVQAIARASEELTFPRDLRREGTRATSLEHGRLLNAFNIPPSTTSEVARLQFRHQIMQRLGLMSGVSGAETQMALVMDRLRQQAPETPRSELRQQAERLLHGSRRTVSLYPESQ